MFERYTEKARRTIFYARCEALCRGSREIEPKHILLGLVHEPHQPDCLFTQLMLNSDEFSAILDADPPIYGPHENKDIPLSLKGKKAVAYAALEAKRDLRYSIGRDHLLRGVMRTGDESAAKIASAGYTLSAVRKASKKLHRLEPDLKAPALWWLRLYLQPFLLGTALIAFAAVLLYLHSQN